MAEEPKGTAGTETAGKVQPAQKVELDLDDAPFLEDDEPEPEPEKQPEPEADADDAPAPPPEEAKLSLKDRLLARLLANKKKLIMAGAGAVLLIGAGVGVNVFLFGEKAEPEPPAVPALPPERVEMRPAPLPQAEVPQFMMRFEPFWVEARDTEGGVRFLTARFTIPTNNPILFAEMSGKLLILRDALFYYLRNQPIKPLNTPELAAKFKEDLLAVLNEHLGSGKADEILIEEFLIQ